MSNMTKQFKAKAKRGLCLAQGFVPDEPQAQPHGAGIDGMSLGGDQTYGDLKNMDRLTAGQYTNDPEILNAAMDREGLKRYIDYSPQPTQMANKLPDAVPQQIARNPLPTVSQPQQSMLGQNGLLGLRQARSPSGFANGLVHEGPGIVHGPGGPKEDKVDAKLSNGEAVLPAATVAALGGANQVASLIERTNGKAPTIGLREGAYADGLIIDQAGNISRPGQIAAQLPPPQAVPNPNAGTALQTVKQPVMSPAPTIQQPAITQPAKPFGMGNALGKAAVAGTILANGYNAVTNQDPAEQVSSTIKGGLTANPVTRPIGMGLNIADGLLDSATGLNMAKGLDKLASFHPDYMRDKVDPQGGSYSSIPMDQKKAGAAKGDTVAPAIPTNDQEAMRDAAMASTLGAPGRPMDDKSMAYLRSQGVDTGLRRAARDDVDTINGNSPEKVQGGAVNIINTKNGPVYAGRDAKGQLVVTSGLDRSDADQAAATKSGQEQAAAIAAKDKADLRGMERDRLTRDTGADITDPRVVQAGLRGLAQMNQQDAVTTAAANHKDELGLRGRQMDLLQRGQDIGDKHYQQELSARVALAQAAAKEKGIQNMTGMVEKSGYKDQEQQDFTDFVMQNHADNLATLPHDEQLKVLPRLKADFQDMKVRNANSTNGTSWKNGKRVKVDKLDYEKDAAIDPTGVIDNQVWFGSGTDGKGLGKANIFLRKNLPDVMFGTDGIDVMDNGQRIMSKDNRGARGPQGSIDMREINRLSLRDAAK